MKLGALSLVALTFVSWSVAVGARPSGHVETALPDDASQPTLVRDPDSGISIAFRVLGATKAAVARRTSEGIELDNALDGATLTFRALPDGIEDRVVFPPGSTRASVGYSIALDGVAGLRNVGTALEFLDRDGTPRLRMAPPFLITNDGALHAVEVKLVGCQADRSPLPPWRRAVVAPGASQCELWISWDPVLSNAGVVLDPVWVTTANLAVKRVEHSATLLSNGLVLVGGEESSFSATGRTTELYDPATGTWAMGAQANVSLNGNLAARLGASKVLFVMGDDVQIYDETTGTFANGPPLVPDRYDFALSPLANGSVLVSGGDGGSAYLTDTQIFDATTLTWKPTSAMHQTRARHKATLLASGLVLVSGGVVFGTVNATSELYDPASGIWGFPANMSAAHAWHVADRLADGKVILQGGQKQVVGKTSLFDPTTGQWAPSNWGAFTRYGHSGVALPDGSFIVTGGYGHDDSTSLGNSLANAEVWSPSGNWALTSPMVTDHYLHTTTLLSGDATHARVLVVGGDDLTSRASEILDGFVAGQPCSSGSQCLGNACVDGFCCDSKCNSPCVACSAALKGSGKDGECGPVQADTDPDDDCEADEASSCNQNGNCDGAGACALYAAGTECKEGACFSDNTTFVEGWRYVCDGQGDCDKTTENCCYHDGQQLDYCSCVYGVCQFPSGGTGGGSGDGGTSGGGAYPATGGFGGGNGGTAAVGGNSSSSGCGCSFPGERTSSPFALLLIASLFALRRRRE